MKDGINPRMRFPPPADQYITPFPRDSFSHAVHTPKINKRGPCCDSDLFNCFLIALIFLFIRKICSSEAVFSARKGNQCLSAVSP